MPRKVISFRRIGTHWRLYLLLLPTFAGILVFSYYPALESIRYSFYKWDGAAVKEFRGLYNYSQIFVRDPVFWRSFRLVAVLIAANLLKMIPPIITAVALHRLMSETCRYVYRVMFVIPMIVPGLVILLIWKSFFDPTVGVLNSILASTGALEVLKWLDAHLLHWQAFVNNYPAWLGHKNLVLPSLILWGFPWVSTFGVLIYLAGLEQIGVELYESADIDGATWWSKFRYIEFPLILTQVRIMLILGTIGLLRDYGFFLILLGPQGGPDNAGLVPGLYMFTEAFYWQRYGYACALGMILFFIILGITLVYQRYVRIEK